ncbi:conserved oligomeric Golgi complex subunit 3-like [Clavelina lepadiformis]|uniref:conserved oligomeric Golgi complex subunit 3-like n=1 Tax=Clavelina lepadiformis TaxID=159417 RepID=UPI004042D8E7
MESNLLSSPELSCMDKLSKWDGNEDSCLAPLNELQKDSFLELASVATNRPMPIEVPLEEPINTLQKVSMKGVVIPGSDEDILAQGFASLGMGREKIDNAQQFYSWFSKIEEQMGKMEIEEFMKQVETLRGYCDYCHHITADVNRALDSLDKLDEEYVFVSTKTNALHDACEHLLADQTALINTADAIQENLEYFLEYDRINAKLSSLNLQVTGDSFQSMLTRIDECIEFMKAHATYKDAASYMVKYKGCLLTALGMIKSYVVKSLETTTQTILNRKSDSLKNEKLESSAPSDDAFTLYYGKFRTNAPKIKGLMEQIEQRAEKNEEYKQLLTDIHTCYFAQRELLLSPSVTSAMADLVNINKTDHCALVRSGCAFMVHVCEDEHQLYSHFFSMHSVKLHEMLLHLCGNLYDLLRPLIIHVYHLETLAELCSILKMEMIDDHVQNNPEQLQAFHSVALEMLEDVQERLVYRANIYIRDDIRGYKPSPGDIAYPEKLKMMEEIAHGLKQSKQGPDETFTEIKLDDESSTQEPANMFGGLEDSTISTNSSMKSQQKFRTSPADMHGMWFPTVRRVLVCLSKLYRCIDKTIFQGLSQEALEACVQSLVSASLAIKAVTVKPNSTEKKVIDGQLFLIKHLLILREQIAPFHTDFAIRETQLDFSRTKDAAFRFVLEPRSIPNLLRVNSNNSLIQLIYEGAPEVKEFYIDSKKDVDRQLKLVCEEFIQHQTACLVGPLNEFLTKAARFINMSKDDGGKAPFLRQQQFGTPEILHGIVSQVYRDLKLYIKKVTESMALYLANKETENILFKPIKVNVQNIFQQLHMLLLDNYTEEDQAIVAAPSSDQVGLLMSTATKL